MLRRFVAFSAKFSLYGLDARFSVFGLYLSCFNHYKGGDFVAFYLEQSRYRLPNLINLDQETEAR